jgi:polysaccharide biosynthesis protein PelF
MFSPTLFESFFLGGFECSTHRRRDGKRLDMIAATEHDRLVTQDYQQLAKFGIRSMRDGLRWHLIETSPGHYDWSSFLPMLRAARDTETQVIWDLCHYGWPDDLDFWSPAFVRRFAAFSREVAHVIKEETDSVPFYAPVNEISFWAWAGGEVSYLNPFARGKGKLLKRQLVRAAIEAVEAVSDVEPRARFVYPEPVINIIADPRRPQDKAPAEAYRQSQYQSWDMIAGRLMPELGGQRKYLDIIGVNYYWNNQWMHKGRTIERGNPLYKPFKDILAETYHRYERPIFIAETGIEHERRPAWLRYVCEQSRAAISDGVPLEGICLYPVMNHPGWDNERHTQCGMLDFTIESGERAVYHPLATELRFQQTLFDSLWQTGQKEAAVTASAG